MNPNQSSSNHEISNLAIKLITLKKLQQSSLLLLYLTPGDCRLPTPRCHTTLANVKRCFDRIRTEMIANKKEQQKDEVRYNL